MSKALSIKKDKPLLKIMNSCWWFAHADSARLVLKKCHFLQKWISFNILFFFQGNLLFLATLKHLLIPLIAHNATMV